MVLGRTIISRSVAVACGGILLAGLATGQKSPDSPIDGIWSRETAALRTPGDGTDRPVFRADRASLEAAFATAPAEGAAATSPPARVPMPFPDGTFHSFDFVETAMMAPGLAARFPQIKTYFGTGVKSPQSSARVSVTPAGIHVQMLGTEGGAIYLDPLSPGDPERCVAYWRAEAPAPDDHWHCLAGPAPKFPPLPATSGALQRPSSGSQLRTYRIAVATTGEYTAFHGGTVPLGMAAVVSAVNRVTGIFESELAIRLQLVANNDLLIYTDPGTDPYTNDNPSALLSENQSNTDAVIGSANYDIGHVFSTGGGGLASFGVVGGPFKARGETGSSRPVGDSFFVDYVAHEIGHQFRGSHTFNGDSGNCSGANRDSSAAYEPGSGSTIMAYASICGDDNLQGASDPFFHWKSFDEITDFVEGSIPDVGTLTATGNTVPEVDAGPGFTIPARTPFVLTATGSDADNDPLTYSWEQADLGPQQDVNAGDNGSSPLFRSFPPTGEPSRTFPRLGDLLNNTTVIGETLPTTTRTLKFRVTARDNQPGGGGVRWDETALSVVDTGAPFRVTSPDTAVTWSTGTTQNVTWDVAGTTSNGIGAATVDISLSTDGGITYPTVLAGAVANDGSQLVQVPAGVESTSARVRVQPTGGIFFDVSDTGFTIADTNGFALTAAPPHRDVCAPEDAVYEIGIVDFSGDVTLSATGLPAGTTATFTPNPVPAGSLSSTLTISGTAAAPPGETGVTVVGTAAGSSGGETPLALTIFHGAPASGPALTSPADSTTGVPLSTEFTWEPVPDATGYLLQISEGDPSFAGPLVIATGGLTTATFPLPPSTTLDWRVLAVNPCGSTASPARSFTTASAFAGAVSNPDLAIPDDEPAGVTDILNVDSGGTISDLDVALDISHAWAGDLNVTLTHLTTSTSANLIFRLDEGNCSGQGLDIILDDDATETAAANCQDAPDPAFPSGNRYRPASPLSIFDGQDIGGQWELSVSDNAGEDVGTLHSWSLLPTIPDPTSPYEDWLSANFSPAQIADPLVGGPNADPDADGRDNISEYTFGCAPLVADFLHGGVTVIEGPTGTADRLRYQVSTLRYDASVSPQSSSGLAPGSWSALPRNVIATEGPVQTLETPLPASSSDRRFLRLGISIPD